MYLNPFREFAFGASKQVIDAFRFGSIQAMSLGCSLPYRAFRVAEHLLLQFGWYHGVIRPMIFSGMGDFFCFLTFRKLFTSLFFIGH